MQHVVDDTVAVDSAIDGSSRALDSRSGFVSWRLSQIVAARADELIEKLPDHYRTVIGDGGARLSVGEKQRINLARAFLKDAPILLMDEPTSALDVESEAQVVASLFALMRGRTTLMVAHRLTTIRRVDKILVVDNGRLTEMGAPEDLLAEQGYYARVVGGQLDGNIDAASRVELPQTGVLNGELCPAVTQAPGVVVSPLAGSWTSQI